MNAMELFDTVTKSPFFGVALTALVYFAVAALLRRRRIPLLTPFLISVAVICALLWLCRIPYENYNVGGSLISQFTAPATVILAVPVYRQRKRLLQCLFPVLGGILLGVLASFFSTFLFALLFDIRGELFLSLLPHSLTTPIATALADEIGGVATLAILGLMISANLGALLFPLMKRCFCIYDPVAHGVAAGTCSHVIGTATVAAEGEVEGAFAGLSIGIAGFVTVLLVPFLLKVVSL